VKLIFTLKGFSTLFGGTTDQDQLAKVQVFVEMFLIFQFGVLFQIAHFWMAHD
jgi:hypothetical protein